MRLGIRRKLIGTLMLVGLFPLAMSLIVILGGGAAMQLRTIRNSFENAAADCGNQLTSGAREEIDKLVLLSRLPLMIEEVRQAGQRGQRPAPTTAAPAPMEEDLALDARWADLTPADEPVKSILTSPLAERFRVLAGLDSRHRELLATDIHGRLIAASVKTADYFQADEDWWKACFDEGRGRPYMSSVTRNPASGRPCVEFAVPVYDDKNPARLLGVLKDKIDVEWIAQPITDVASRFGAAAQVIDTATDTTVFPPDGGEQVEAAARFFKEHRGRKRSLVTSIFSKELVIGTSPVILEDRLSPRFANIDAPHWVVVVSKPGEEAMVPIYQLAITVAGIGVALILVLFILGVAIANREIIMPVLRLREATAAVGRGELNVRLMPSDQQDPTFRLDELGELARDFDTMTRTLQKHVNTLAHSNEAKRRFMELAGHELRTPVTYIISACQLAQRQLQQLAKEQEQSDAAVATGAKTNAQVASSMGKTVAKAQRLSHIIENLLKLVQTDQFINPLDKTSIDVRALILQVTSDARAFVQERKQQLVLDVPENLPSFEGDRNKLEDVLTNLISNAIRFSPDESTIKVAAHVTVGDMLEILIEDAGSGIPKEDLDNLFQPFYTGSDIMHHHSGEHEYRSKGIGLGLAIVRRFVEIHGGVVRVHSTGHGTQFQILLPLGKDIIPNPPTPGADGEPGGFDSPPPEQAQP